MGYDDSCKISPLAQNHLPRKINNTMSIYYFSICQSTTSTKTLKQNIAYILKKKNINAFIINTSSFIALMSFIIIPHLNREQEQFLHSIINKIGKFYPGHENFTAVRERICGKNSITCIGVDRARYALVEDLFSNVTI